jgi:hypothetical protein
MGCQSIQSSVVPLLTLCVAAAAAGFGGLIAFRQWRTAQNRLRLDLFERRLDVYEAAMFFAASVANRGKFADGSDFTYLTKTRSARWLFGKDFADWLSENVYKGATRLATITEMLPSHEAIDERKAAIATQTSARERLTVAMMELQERAAPFLELKDA